MAVRTAHDPRQARLIRAPGCRVIRRSGYRPSHKLALVDYVNRQNLEWFVADHPVAAMWYLAHVDVGRPSRAHLLPAIQRLSHRAFEHIDGLLAIVEMPGQNSARRRF